MTYYAQGDGIELVEFATPEAFAEARAAFIAANPDGVTIQWEDEDEEHTYPAGEWWDSIWGSRSHTVGIDMKCSGGLNLGSMFTRPMGGHHE